MQPANPDSRGKEGVCVFVCYTVAAEDTSPVPLCNGEKTATKTVDDNTNTAGGLECKVESQATTSNNTAASTSVVNVNERLLPSSVVGDCHTSLSTDADISSSRSFTNDTSLSSGDEFSLPQLASEDTSQSVLGQP